MQGTFTDAGILCHVARPVAHLGGDLFYQALLEAMSDIVAVLFLVILQIPREVADTERDRFVCFRCARFSVKFSLVLHCGLFAPINQPMTMSTTLATPLLLLFADAYTAPALLSQFSGLVELMVALSCRLALDSFCVAQQYFPPPPVLPAHDPGHDFWF